ncbi:MAG TPA: urea ABC transporter permease subunit UrtB [Polyangiales bacterium]|nr:urea ABC transporter permease subunit UrtB [Polyangiales bacterium]
MSRRGLCGIVLCVALGFSGLAAADGGELDALFAKLASDDRALMGEAISGLGKRDEPAALAVLLALRDGKLRADAAGKLYVSADAGLLDARTGKPAAADQASLRNVTTNNVLRRQLGPALAELGLKARDPAVRLAAAEALNKASDEKLAPAMRAAFAKETDPAVKASLKQSLAQLDLGSQDPARRISAVKAMAESGDVAFKAQLSGLLEKEQDDTVRAAAKDALSAIENHEFLARVVRDLFYGLSLGSVLLLAAIGLAVTFGLMRVINMAHGEMLMFGAYSTYVAQLIFQKYLPNALDWYLVLAVPLAFGVCMLLGMALERSVIHFLYWRPLETLLSTWGISLMLIQLVRLVFGAQNVAVANPSWLSGGFELMSGVVLPYNRVATILFVVGIVLFVAWLLQRTSLGLQVRAITQNRAMAACMGIATKRIDMLTFGLGSGLAGLGGVALSQIGNVGPELGQLYIVDSFMVVVVGGVGKIAGSVVAAIGLGTINKVLEPFAGAVLGKIFVLVFVVLFIQRRPQGLFALKGRSAES